MPHIGFTFAHIQLCGMARRFDSTAHFIEETLCVVITTSFYGSRAGSPA